MSSKKAKQYHWTRYEEGVYIPSWKHDRNMSGHTTFILNNSLYCTTVEDDNKDSFKPFNAISINPVTMKQCRMVIGSPVLAVVSSNAQSTSSVTVGTPWPSKSMDLDKVSLSKSVSDSLNVSVHGGDVMRIEPLTQSFITPSVRDVYLSLKSTCFDVNESFKNFLLIQLDDHTVCQGSSLCVKFHDRNVEFIINSLVIEGADLNSSSCNGITDCVKSLSLLDTPIKSCDSVMSSPASSSYTSTPLPKLVDYNDSINDVSQRFNNTPSIDQLIIGKITMSTKIHIKMKQDISMYSLPNLSEVGGLKEQIKELQTLVIKPFNQPDRYITELGVIFPKGILLYGTSGTGKTLLAEAIINELDDAVHKVIINEEMMLKESGYLDGVLSEARDHSPSVILINDIDEICPYGKDLPLTDVQLNNVIALRKHFDLLSKSPPVPHNVVIATTNDLNSVHTRLKLPGRFDKEVELTTPTSIDRRAILMIMLKEIHHDLSEEDINNIALESHGRVGADLKKICQVAQHIALKREDDKNVFSVDRETFKEALKIIQPSVMREIWIEVPQVKWSDIGGQREVKQQLIELVEWPLTRPELFHRMSIQAPRGILLYGPPGCSKTMIARAVATESKMNFISIKGPEIFSKWVGDSEMAVRQIFRRARLAAPSVIFFDEIDALAITRNDGEGGSKVGNRVLTQLLTEIDGIERLEDVLIIAATNRPDMIDKALIRPGRIDRKIYVPLPNELTRIEILKLHLDKIPIDQNVDINYIAKSTEGYSGAEIVVLVKEAVMCALRLETQSVTQDNFDEALMTVKAQTGASTIHYYENFFKSFNMK